MTSESILRKAQLLTYGLHPNLVIRFCAHLGALPNIAMPGTYSEKMLWRKVFDRNPEITRLSDKLIAKQHFCEQCPEIKSIPVLWEGHDPQEIPDDLLQADVVVKTNHGSGFNIFLRNGNFDRQHINTRLQTWISRRYGGWDGEWGYGTVVPKVYVEPLLLSDSNSAPIAFCVHVFSGRAMLVEVFDGDCHGPVKCDIFDVKGRKFDAYPYNYRAVEQRLPRGFELPSTFGLAIELAEKLGKNFDHVRVDFISCENNLYGSEFTFYHVAGYARWTDPRISQMLNCAWKLKDSWFFSQRHIGWKAEYASRLLERLAANEPG